MLVYFYFMSTCASSPMILLTSTSRQENFDSHLLIVHYDLKWNKKIKIQVFINFYSNLRYIIKRSVYENLYRLTRVS